MNAMTNDFPGQRRHADPVGAPAADGGNGLAQQWQALREAVWAIAALAGPQAQAEAALAVHAPAGLDLLSGARLAHAERYLGDLVAVLEAGLGAILTAHEQGARPAAAAQALWREFLGARAALAALAPLPSE